MPNQPPLSILQLTNAELLMLHERVARTMFNSHNTTHTWETLRNPKIRQTYRSYAAVAINEIFRPASKGGK